MSTGKQKNGHVILAGGSGFIGGALAESLAQRGYEPVILTRRAGDGGARWREVAWDGRTVGGWAETLEGAAAVVNLTGRSVDCRYTPENRREILESRLHSVAALADAIRRSADPPKAFVQAASLAIYGDTRELCDEGAPFGTGFSVDVCTQWERAWSEMALPATRTSLLRIGFALGAGGGALPTLANLARRGLGGTVGSGTQYISWLHVADLNEMFRWAIEREDVTGIFNATGPTPVTNREFMRVLRAVLNRPWSPPVPAWLVRIGAALMGTEASLALTGRRCVPKRFLDMGFTFRYTDLEATLRELLVSQR